MMRAGAALCLAALVSGCAASEWVRPEATEADYMRDSYHCARVAAQMDTIVAQGVVGVVKLLIPVRKMDGAMYDGCMASRGYTRLDR